jgi:Heparinase II/III-like protein
MTPPREAPLSGVPGHHLSRGKALLGVLVTVLLCLGAAPPAGAQVAGPVKGRLHVASVTGEDSLAVVEVNPVSPDCGRAATSPVPDGEPIVVELPPAAPFTLGSIPAAAWRSPASQDPTWRLHFEGFIYLPSLAQRAAQDGSRGSLDIMVDQIVAFHEQNPDTGGSVYGWDEGTAQRRLWAENCLYALTHSSLLVPGMQADARVQLGERYSGPPLYPVHNHGLMANLRLARTAELLDNAGWRDVALSRLRDEAPLAFTARGTTWEQSSGYQALNTDLWQQAADTLSQTPGYEVTVAAIRDVTRRAAGVAAWVTEPDGRIVQIGDSDRGPGRRATARTHVFRDDQAGLVIGKWSATDLADVRATYYTLRYGPPRRAHGHQDRSGVTWSTDGVRVLVGPGRYTYQTGAPELLWQRTPVAHNVAVPETGRLSSRASVSLTYAKVQAAAHAWQTTDDLYPRHHVRTVNVNNLTRAISVTDQFSGAGAFRQSWHLDPVWRVVSAPRNGQRLVFADGAGRRLTVTTTGRLSGVQSGVRSPLAGWTFPAQGRRVPAAQITIRSTGVVPGPVVTRFVVTR